MRIAAVTTSFLPKVGGAEFAVHHLAQQWARHGHDVTVVNNSSAEPSQADTAYRVRRYPLARGTLRFGYHRWPFVVYEALHLTRILRELRPDFISAHFAYPLALWLNRVRPLPRFVITEHGPALDERPEGPRQRYRLDRALARAMNRATAVVAISSDARRIMESFGVEARRIVDIPNGADLARFQRKVVDLDVRARFGVPSAAPLVLSVGRDTWEKAYDTAIRAFSRVAASVPDAWYLIVGRDARRWAALAAEMGVVRRVVFCDGLYGDELVGAYQQADVFVMPSRQEVCPLVVAEAMAAGLPEVVTNISGSQDMVRHELNGLVVAPDDAEGLARAVVRLLGDEDARRRMAQASRERAELYSWERISRLYLALATDGPAPG